MCSFLLQSAPCPAFLWELLVPHSPWSDVCASHLLLHRGRVSQLLGKLRNHEVEDLLIHKNQIQGLVELTEPAGIGLNFSTCRSQGRSSRRKAELAEFSTDAKTNFLNTF